MPVFGPAVAGSVSRRGQECYAASSDISYSSFVSRRISFALTVGSLYLVSPTMNEVIFDVREDVIDGGFTASALGFGIHTQADTEEELRANLREAVDCYFEETDDAPKIIRLHFVRDEVMTR
jgi:predicted RNase H-like HicB family nuclease